MEISSKYINEIIQDNASILGNLNKSIRDFKEYCSSAENEEIFKNDVSKFAYQVLINRWTQYHYSRIMYPESPKYNENLRTFMKEIICYLPQNMYKHLNKISLIIQFPEYKLEDFGGDEAKMNKFHESCTCDELILIEIMIKVGIHECLNNFFDFTKHAFAKKEINGLFFGQNDVGKTKIFGILNEFFQDESWNRTKDEKIWRTNLANDKKHQIGIGELNLNIFKNQKEKDFDGNSKICFLRDFHKLNVDNKLIFYFLDLDCPRINESEYLLLSKFMEEMKLHYPDNLDYLSKVFIVGSNADKIILREFEKYGGVPDYNFEGFLEEKNLIFNQESLDEYNKHYANLLRFSLDDWYIEITTRVHKKIFEGVVEFDDGGQSFFVYLRQIGERLYPHLDEEYFDDIISKINVLITGKTKNMKMDELDPKNYNVCKIPDIEGSLNTLIKKDNLLKTYIKTFTYENNWLTKFLNKIYTINISDRIYLDENKIPWYADSNFNDMSNNTFRNSVAREFRGLNFNLF